MTIKVIQIWCLLIAALLMPSSLISNDDMQDPAPMPWDSDDTDDGKTRYQFETINQGLKTVVTIEVKKVVVLANGQQIEHYILKLYQRNDSTGNQDVLSVGATLTPHPVDDGVWISVDPRRKVTTLLSFDKKNQTWSYGKNSLEILELTNSQVLTSALMKP